MFKYLPMKGSLEIRLEAAMESLAAGRITSVDYTEIVQHLLKDFIPSVYLERITDEASTRIA